MKALGGKSTPTRMASRSKVEVYVDGRVHAVLYARDFYIVADNEELELHASVNPIPTRKPKVAQ